LNYDFDVNYFDSIDEKEKIIKRVIAISILESSNCNKKKKKI